MADIFAYENGTNTLAFVLMGLVVGIIAACLCMLYQIKVPGKIVRLLTKAKAYSEEAAVDAAAIGHKNEWVLRFLFSENGALRKYVGVIFTQRDKKGRGIYYTAKYYLIEATRDRAELRYCRKNATVGALIAAIIIFSAVGVALNFIIPELTAMLGNFIGMIKS